MDHRTTSLIFPAVSSSFDTAHAEPSSPVALSLQDLLTAPARAEHILNRLTSDQITLIEQTIDRVKRRKVDQTVHAGTPSSSLLIKKEKPTPKPQAANTAPTALTVAMPSIDYPSPIKDTSKPTTSNQSEPMTVVRNGIEWVSFVYSHNRVIKRYSIRTDVHSVSMATIDATFKNDNCVYPRANLPKETYRGNRWDYETECNLLGWKLAWLNRDISGKRGLVQRAVDSYRNRYPNMRSRRMARQEKLLNGTLRKRKHRNESNMEHTEPTTHLLSDAIVKPAHCPKTITIDEDSANGRRFRIKIDVEQVALDEINATFRRQNCAFPRAMDNARNTTSSRARLQEETLCNELGWKLAWLNPRVLSNKQNRLQRALDVYRTKFMPDFQPRKRSNKNAQLSTPPLTQSALSEQNARYAQLDQQESSSPPITASVVSSATDSFDFDDCLSLALSEQEMEGNTKPPCTADVSLSPSPSTVDYSTTTVSSSSSSNTSAACTPSPYTCAVPGMDIHDSFTLPPIMDDSFLLYGLPSSAEDIIKIYDPAPPTSAMGDGSNELDSLTLF